MTARLSFAGASYGYAALAFVLLEQLRVLTEVKLVGTFTPNQWEPVKPVFDVFREFFDGGFILLMAAWVLLTSLASFRNRRLTRPLAYSGILASLVLLLTGAGCDLFTDRRQSPPPPHRSPAH